MNVEKQNSPELRSLAERIEGSRTAMLTLCDAQGQLSSLPMTVLEMDGQGCLWILVSNSGQTARMAAEGSGVDTVNLAFSDESSATFTSITARATLSNDRHRKEALWTVMARPWFPQGGDDPDLAVLRRVGLPVAVGNAVAEVRRAAQLQLSAHGGHGAVREFAEALLLARDEWTDAVERYVASRSAPTVGSKTQHESAIETPCQDVPA